MEQDRVKNTISLETLLQAKFDKYSSLPALICGDKIVTYSELAKLTNKVAQALLDLNIKSRDNVLIYCTRSIEMIALVISCVKIGAVYIWGDPNSNLEQKEFQLSEYNPNLVIYDEMDILIERKENSYLLNEILNFTNFQDKEINFIPKDPRDIFCILSSSGTTGHPKAVIRFCSSVFSQILSLKNSSSTDIISNTSNLNFAPSIAQIFGGLCFGSHVVIVPENLKKDPEALIQYCNHHKINRISFVPSILKSFLEIIEHDKIRLPDLKFVTSTGEKLSQQLITKFTQLLPGVSFVNSYGTSETGGIGRNDLLHNKDGRFTPYEGVKIKIISPTGNVLDPGQNGEILVATEGLGKYHNNKYNDKFILLGKEEYFKTGDFGNIDSGGRLQILGRIDNIVKINGLQINLDDIKETVMQYDGVTDAAVTRKPNKNGGLVLALYYVPREAFEVIYLKNFIREKYDQNALPHYYVPLQKLPFLNNGKVDYRSLPSLSSKYYVPDEDSIAPHGALEIKLSSIWRDLLDIEFASNNKTYFQLGGSSLDIVKLKFAIKNNFSLDISIKRILMHNTIKSLASYISTIENSKTNKIIVGRI